MKEKQNGNQVITNNFIIDKIEGLFNLLLLGPSLPCKPVGHGMVTLEKDVVAIGGSSLGCVKKNCHASRLH